MSVTINGSTGIVLGGNLDLSAGKILNSTFIENQQIITTDYNIGANKNAGSFGPIDIALGVTVTIPDGSTWSIV